MRALNTVYLSLGSNVGDSIAHLDSACSKIEIRIGSILQKSSLYTTAAWGNTEQPDFVNQAIIVETQLDCISLMQTILVIEQEMGRIRTVKNAPRIIDIDILFYNDAIIEEHNLCIPHPLLHERNFVLTPLMELSPNWIHPVQKLTIHQLQQACTDTLPVKKK
jgi:2-amino-4-hydroxy-6-hydroxymethyldihydropteridine diphosphokinase